MYKTITIDSQEFKDLYNEIISQNETKQKRMQMSDYSFREWLCKVIEEIAGHLGYHIQNLYEFTLDIADSFQKGYQAGRSRARANAIRNK